MNQEEYRAENGRGSATKKFCPNCHSADILNLRDGVEGCRDCGVTWCPLPRKTAETVLFLAMGTEVIDL